MKSYYDHEPLALQQDNDGTTIFRYNIEAYEAEEGAGWKCDEVRLYGSDKASIKRALIRDRYDENKEFSIINKYNSHVMGITDNPEAVTNYTDYLNFLKNIDEVILSNF